MVEVTVTDGHRATVSRPGATRKIQPVIDLATVTWRVAHIFVLLVQGSVRLCWLVIASMSRSRRSATAFDAWLVGTITDFGPSFVKAAQMLSTRADLLPPRVCRTLGTLHDAVRPMRAVHAAKALGQLGGELGVARAAPTAHPVACGSIACVYRVVLPDGRTVAAKVRRPGIERTLAVDLTIMRLAARALATIPRLRAVPIVEIVTRLTDSLRGQLDLLREGDDLRDLRRGMASIADVRVPQPYPDLSSEDVLVMEFVEDLHRRRPEELAEGDRRRAVISTLRAVYQMLFIEGLVHCDLHPGNLYFRADGSVVIVDAGFTVRLSRQAHDKFTAFFYCMTIGDGQACADIVLSTATANEHTDTGSFRVELSALVESSTGARANEFDLVSFATRLFDLQRRHGLYADPQFVFPILSLIVLEGTIREFFPDVDFQGEAMPFLVKALFQRFATAATKPRP